MANTIQVTATVSVSGGGATWQQVISKAITQSSAINLQNIQTIGTSDEAILVGDVTGPYLVMLTNLDPTNYVEIDSASTYDKFPQKLLPDGVPIILRPETTTIHAKANTGACNVAVLLVSP